MTLKKLASFLTLGVMIGQITLIPTVIAVAETQDLNQIASVIQQQGDYLKNFGLLDDRESRQDDDADVFTVELGENKLPTIIQVLRQDEESTSLYLNGSEVLRLRGEIHNMDAYQRVKIVAERLNKALEQNADAAELIEPAIINNMPVVKVGDDVLVTVDPLTAKEESVHPKRLAFSLANKFRQPLGSLGLAARQFPQFASDILGYIGTGKVQRGEASWYGPGFHGRRTASGTRYDMYEMTAAHRTLPFGTMVKVTNQRNQKSCVVKITDRGPFAHGRIIDLSKRAAENLGITGVGPVTVEIVEPYNES